MGKENFHFGGEVVLPPDAKIGLFLKSNIGEVVSLRYLENGQELQARAKIISLDPEKETALFDMGIMGGVNIKLADIVRVGSMD